MFVRKSTYDRVVAERAEAWAHVGHWQMRAKDTATERDVALRNLSSAQERIATLEAEQRQQSVRGEGGRFAKRVRA